jgi:hypothetical protein
MKKLNKHEIPPVTPIGDSQNIYDSENRLKEKYRRSSEPWNIRGPYNLEPDNQSLIQRIAYRLKNLGR